MENTKITMSIKQLQRFEVISQLLDGHINGTQAGNKLSLSTRQVRRLKKKVKTSGAQGLIHGNTGRKSNRALSKEKKEEIITLIKEKYHGFKPTLANEKLEELHKIKISTETLRLLMIKEGLWKPKRRRASPQHRSWRPRLDREGDMEQFDGSYHRWIEALGDETQCLLAAIDDATGKVTKLKLEAHEGIVPVFTFWREYIEKQGRLPKIIYLDKFSTYKINHKQAEDNSELVTQFERAMNTLGVKLIRANSPQAKGRVERLNRTLQDRMVKEMTLAGIKSVEEANKWLEDVYVKKFNDKFSVVPAKSGDGYVSVPKDADLDSIFSKHYRRRVNNDFTVRFNNKWYQITKDGQSASILRKDYVRVEERLDGTVAMYLERRNVCLKILELPERPKRINARQIIPATTRKSYKPAKDHPWRKFKI